LNAAVAAHAARPAKAPATGLRFAKSTLAIGEAERVASWCDDGLLLAEYALFEPADVVLRASDPTAVFEAGYRTTARKGLERLARSGVTLSAAEDAVRAISRDVVRALVRCEAARAVANRLGAAEILDGARFGAGSGVYQGAWIDLKRLVDALDLPGASVLLQALYLAAALSEVPGKTPIVLSTSTALRGRRPSERSHVSPTMPPIDRLFDALANLATFAAFDARPPNAVRERRLRPALLARIRERADQDASPAVRHHLESLETAFTRTSAAGHPDASPRPTGHPDASPRPTGHADAAPRPAGHADAAPRPVAYPDAAPRPGSTPAAADADDRHEPPPAPAPPQAPSTAIVLHASTLPSLDRLGGIVVPSGERPARYVPELVESLSPPHGADENLLDRYALPTTPLEARVAMTRLARELGRDYRVRHGKALRCDVMAIEAMQLQLLRLTGAQLQDREVAWQLRRHGALLSEIFARALGGEWIDIGHKEAAYWMMRVPPDLHVRPIGSVFQFVADGATAASQRRGPHPGGRAGDLVAQFLELDRRRKASRAEG
jgi:hypothetical protein